MKEELRKLGLTNTEINIYLTLIQAKELTAVEISKKIETHRRTIYDNLNLLARKGLVSQKTKNKINYFSATNPQNLKILLEEKTKSLTDILPTLNKYYKSNKEETKVNIFVGLAGAKSIVEDALNSKQEALWVGGGLFFFQALKYSRNFIEQKTKKLNLKVIQPNTEETKSLNKLINKTNLRTLPKEFISKSGYLVYGNKTAIGIIEDPEITVILIENKECAKAFKNYFNTMWKLAN